MILRLQLSTASLIPNPKPKPRAPHTHLILPPRCLSSYSTACLISSTPQPATSGVVDPGVLFREKLAYLEVHFGLDSYRALSLNPDLRSHPLASLRTLADVLDEFGLSAPCDASRILYTHPSLLTCDPAQSLVPILRFLVDEAGFSSPSDVRKAVIRCPRLLMTSVHDQLQPAFYFLIRLGFVGSRSISPQTSPLLVSSVEDTLIPKLDYIQSLGLSYKDTVKMVLRCPALFTYSIENNFRPKAEFLVGEMGRDVAELKDCPQYFAFSLENKIKPRHRFLVEHGFPPMPLSDMLKPSDSEFQDRLLERRAGLFPRRRF